MRGFVETSALQGLAIAAPEYHSDTHATCDDMRNGADLIGLADETSPLQGLAKREHTMVSDSSELCLSTLLAMEHWDSKRVLLSDCTPCSPCTTSCS